MWLSGMAPLDHVTINRFRSERIRPVFESIFTQVVELLAAKGLITLESYFLDGTKIESNANKYTFVWKKATEGYQEKLRPKDKELRRASKAFEQDYLPRMKRYVGQLDIFQERKSWQRGSIKPLRSACLRGTLTSFF